LKRAILIYLSTIGVLGATWWEMRRSTDTPPWSLQQPLDSIPMVWEGLSGVPGELQSAELEALMPSSYLMRSYGSSEGDFAFQLLVVYFASQQAGKSMHSPKNCLPASGWEAVESRIVTVPDGTSTAPVNLYRIRSGEQTMLMLYWYQSPDRVVASELNAKAYLFLDRFHNNRSPGSIVRITMKDQPENLTKGLRVAQWLIPEMRRCLGTSRRAGNATKAVRPE
jgi:EpsI family protein